MRPQWYAQLPAAQQGEGLSMTGWSCDMYEAGREVQLSMIQLTA
jgi:hypothetical protein